MSKGSKKDIFGDEVVENKVVEDFEQMFAQSEKGFKSQMTVGEKFQGEILSIGKEESFVATGTPVDGMIFTRELLDENKQVKYNVGDVIDCVVISLRGGEIRVAKKGSMAASADTLEDAFDMELPVEGKVTEVCNGGFRVSIQGKTAFCPISQIDSRFVQDAAEYVDKKLTFLITQFDKKGRNIVVSRRKLLDLQKAEHEGAFMLKHKPGEVLEGKVIRVEKFGAFVELEAGVEGLVHVSELSWSRVHDPSAVVSVGQAITVKLLSIEEMEGGKLKISLSLKQADGEGNPWNMVPQNFPVGTVVKGKVEKKEVYGLFVSIAPGVTGLLPKSKWRDSVEASQFESKKRGDEILVQIDQILFEEKKISLAIPGEAEDVTWRAHQPTSGSGFASMGDALKGLKLK